MINICLILNEQSSLLAATPPKRDRGVGEQIQPTGQKDPAIHTNPYQSVRAIKLKLTRP